MNIKELAIGIAESVDDGSGEQYFLDPEGWIADFAEAIVAELAKENKPVVRICSEWQLLFIGSEPIAEVVRKHGLKIGDALYTLPPTAEQIEQETAEAIAKHFEQSGIGGEYLAEAIRNGAWKWFNK